MLVTNYTGNIDFKISGFRLNTFLRPIPEDVFEFNESQRTEIH